MKYKSQERIQNYMLQSSKIPLSLLMKKILKSDIFAPHAPGTVPVVKLHEILDNPCSVVRSCLY
jgi:hypothetical protein